MELEKILERAKEHLKVHTDTDVARHLGIKRQDLHQFKKNGSIPFKHLFNLCKVKSLSTDWLILGRDIPTDSEYKDKYIAQLETENRRYETMIDSLLSGEMTLSELGKLQGMKEFKKLF